MLIFPCQSDSVASPSCVCVYKFNILCSPRSLLFDIEMPFLFGCAPAVLTDCYFCSYWKMKFFSASQNFGFVLFSGVVAVVTKLLMPDVAPHFKYTTFRATSLCPAFRHSHGLPNLWPNTWFTHIKLTAVDFCSSYTICRTTLFHYSCCTIHSSSHLFCTLYSVHNYLKHWILLYCLVCFETFKTFVTNGT